MKRLIPIFLLTFIITIFAKCSKTGTQNESPEQTWLVKTKTSSSDTTDYTYDPNGRVTSMRYRSSLTSNGTLTYTYSPGQIKIFETYNGITTLIYLLTLNSDDLVTRVDYSSGTIQNFTYNSDKTKSSETYIYPTYSRRYDYFYTNGNIDSVESSETGRKFQTTYYSYYLNQPRIGDYSSIGQSFYGKDTRKMIKNIKYSSQDQVDYEYTLDSKGRLASTKMIYSTAGTITRTYSPAFTYY